MIRGGGSDEDKGVASSSYNGKKFYIVRFVCLPDSVVRVMSETLTHVTEMRRKWFRKTAVALCLEPNPASLVTADAFADHWMEFGSVCVRCVNILMTGNIISRRVGHEISWKMVRNRLEEFYRVGVSPQEYFTGVLTGLTGRRFLGPTLPLQAVQEIALQEMVLSERFGDIKMTKTEAVQALVKLMTGTMQGIGRRAKVTVGGCGVPDFSMPGDHFRVICDQCGTVWRLGAKASYEWWRCPKGCPQPTLEEMAWSKSGS